MCKREEDNDCPTFSRIRTGTALGTRIRIGEQTSCPLDAAIGGEAGTTAPERPRIADVIVEMRSDPSDGGCCMFCGDLDVMTILVTDVRDDRAPCSHMYLAFYVGNTAEEALLRTTIDHLTSICDEHPYETPRSLAALDPVEGAPARVDLGLGKSAGHERLGKGLLRAGPLCFAVETLDWAGNFSPRSDPVCLDTTDEKDSHVRWEESSSCSVHGRSPAGSIVLALVTGLVIRLGRRSRPR